ncbi:MCE family protein [Fodinicola feengrottensis]|uniref:MCE family protein n=2 Tax=Fodinicola feengrottensis TaxID=435914 RepID=A0ABN2G4N0_9ACTN
MSRGMIGALALVLIAVIAVAGPQVVFYLRTGDYTADFANASGLATGDQVYVAGVAAGRVTGVTLAGDHVQVRFRLDHAQSLGDRTSAGIKVATLLGRRYLSLVPGGSGSLDGGIIPIARTSVPYTLDDLSRATTSTTDQLDLPALQRMLASITEVTPTDNTVVTQTLTGVSMVAAIVSQREGQIHALLTGVQTVTNSLLQQQSTLVTLLGDANLVAQMLNQRRQVIRAMVADLTALTGQVSQFLTQNGPAVNQLLTRLHSITALLAQNDQALGATLTQLAPMTRYLTNATGNGPWGDVSGPAGPLPDNLLCVSALVKGCR